MLLKKEFPHYKVELYKPDLGESILAYSHKGTKEGQKLVKKLISKFES